MICWDLEELIFVHFGWCGYDVDKVILVGPIRISHFDTFSYP